ncbi:MAG: chorismate mutase [Planctomycetaceae bacterium]
MRVRAARGAIVAPGNEAEAILGATRRLLDALVERNRIDHDDLISILFTATDDLDAAFPAEAARRMGLASVPLLCAREIPVAGSMRSVVRVLLHFHTDRGLADIVHVYLDGAEALRDDLEPPR